MRTEDREGCTPGVVQELPAAVVNGSTARRRAADGRKKLQGLTRISVWLPSEAVAMVDLWAQQRGRDAAVELAVHHLSRQVANGLTEICDARWVDSVAVGDGGFEAIGLRLPPSAVAVLDAAGAAAGHASRSVTAAALLNHGIEQLRTNAIQFRPKA